MGRWNTSNSEHDCLQYYAGWDQSHLDSTAGTVDPHSPAQSSNWKQAKVSWTCNPYNPVQSSN